MAAPYRVFPAQWIVQVSHEMDSQMRVAAAEDGTSVSAIIRAAVAEYLTKRAKKKVRVHR